MTKHNDRGFYKKFVKRPMDFILSGLAIIVLSPILGLSALLVRIKLGSPVLFKQARPGKNEKIFYLYKFRSMTNAVDKDGKLLPDSERLTKFGKLLRKTSIDELPELINILKGDMSIVGPRPLSVYYLPHYGKEAKRRHEVQPGLTGLAQVNGRNNLEWDKRFELDVEYVNNVTFWNDVKIIFNTAAKVLKAADISVRGTSKVYDFGTYNRIKEESSEVKMGMLDMSYSEIGSYFWLTDEQVCDNANNSDFLPKVSDEAYTFSGRTAIEIALKNIMTYKQVKRVYVPSYCCISMLQSFYDNDIKVDFYSVKVNNGAVIYNIDENKDCDIILYMNYFGMKGSDVSSKISAMKNKGVTVIEDITHSMFNEDAYLSCSDYLVSSLRKWMAIPTGGWIGKISGSLSVKPNLVSNKTVKDKIAGMKMKYDYLCGSNIEKESYIQINSKFDNDLIHVDRMLMIDDLSYKIIKSADIEAIKNRRKKNSEILKNGLAEIDVIELPDIDFEKNTPLYYPIFLKNEDRDSLRSYLIQFGIYCPVHWPEVMGAEIGIRENELSLICDQRYSEKDMYAICECIRNWYSERFGGNSK